MILLFYILSETERQLALTLAIRINCVTAETCVLMVTLKEKCTSVIVNNWTCNYSNFHRENKTKTLR